VKLIDLEELSKSDYVLFSVMLVKDRLIGLTMIDKIIINSVDSEILEKLKNHIPKSSIITLDLTINCPEDDRRCIERARAMGLEPNVEILAPLSLIAISTKFLDLNRFKELLEKNLGDLYSSMMMSYCTRDELDKELQEYMYYISSIMTSADEDRLFRRSSLDKLNNVAIIVEESGDVKYVNVSI